MVLQHTGHRDSSKKRWLQEEDLAILPKSDLGGDKTLLPSRVHIYGAICYIVMNSLDTCDAHFNVMSKWTLRAWILNYSLALVKIVEQPPVFLKFGHGYAIQWGKQCILDCIPKYQQSTVSHPPRCWSWPFYAVCVFAGSLASHLQAVQKCFNGKCIAGVAEASSNLSQQRSPDCYW